MYFMHFYRVGLRLTLLSFDSKQLSTLLLIPFKTVAHEGFQFVFIILTLNPNT